MIAGNLHTLPNTGLPPILFDILSRPEHQFSALLAQTDGHYQPEGQSWFYTITRAQTQPISKRHVELHLDYLDIQILLTGEEIIRYPLRNCADATKEEKKPDFFILAAPEAMQSLHLRAGDYVIFFAGEAHQALCQTTESAEIRKAVFKIPMALL